MKITKGEFVALVILLTILSLAAAILTNMSAVSDRIPFKMNRSANYYTIVLYSQYVIK